jgi:hypothetical protein
MRYTLEIADKKVKETELTAAADKVRRETAAEAAGREQIIAAKAQEEAMKHVLPFKQKQIEQRALEAQADSAARVQQAEGSAKLAWHFRSANDKYATHYPAAVGFHMTNTDSTPFMDFAPGYFLRAIDQLPKSGSRAPWRLKQNYLLDLRLIRQGKVDDEALHFTKHRAAVGV